MDEYVKQWIIINLDWSILRLGFDGASPIIMAGTTASQFNGAACSRPWTHAKPRTRFLVLIPTLFPALLAKQLQWFLDQALDFHVTWWPRGAAHASPVTMATCTPLDLRGHLSAMLDSEMSGCDGSFLRTIRIPRRFRIWEGQVLSAHEGKNSLKRQIQMLQLMELIPSFGGS